MTAQSASQADTRCEQDILYEVREQIGIVTFNRPQARNALTFAMYERLVEICATVPADGSLRVLLLTGAGDKAFAAGTDISQFRGFKTREHGIDYERMAERVYDAIERCPVPTIAALAGACTGGGAGIAACCDLRLATRDLKWGFPIARTLGNCLSAATLARLVALVGQARVLDLLLTSRLIEAEEAKAIGLVREVHADHAALMTRAWELATQLKDHAPLTMGVTKEFLRRLRQAAPKVEDEDLIAMIYTSADFREGLDAFLTKRRPQWSGK
jgi:enoyl-CoA hydratase